MSKRTIEQELNRTGRILRTTVGVSMEPMLKNRKNIVILVKAENLLKKYDVALYKRPNGQYVLHRVLKVREKDYIICGDNCWKKEVVPHEWVLAYMSGFYKNGRLIYPDNEKYQKYIKTIGIRRKKLWLKAMIKAVIRRIKRIFHEK
ncbi:MAG: S24/S26 family peptidase [Ruminococcus sp.]|nr:S24/S26 family peptidase [Ruminococcus sp.]